MIDHSSRYASHRNLFDHHRDMRLDVDNMSYEELLALGERIGNVSTGMSEDMISKCLNEAIYSAGENHEEGTCPICLEDYAEEEVVGTMNCGHNYHGSCIRKWLLIKNVCPICKAPALADRSKLD
ncbi:RING-type E3 ubiquitin transferase [Sarracenia purpurea var. burkii]